VWPGGAGGGPPEEPRGLAPFVCDGFGWHDSGYPCAQPAEISLMMT